MNWNRLKPRPYAISFGMLLGTILSLLLLTLIAIPAWQMEQAASKVEAFKAPRPPTHLQYSAFRSAPYAVAKVFGRFPACADSDKDFIDVVANIAASHGVDASLFASTIATESGCNPYAVSGRGAIGYTQVMVSVWKNKYDFSKVNLFNPADNLRVGAEIMGDLIQQHGMHDGVTRYQGLGVGCPSCDDGYTAKVLALARLN